jgi:hypothetical protein
MFFIVLLYFQQYLGKRLSESNVCFLYLCQKMTIAVWVYFWIFHSIPLVYMSIFALTMLIFVTMALVQFELMNCSSIALGLWGHINDKVYISSYIKNDRKYDEYCVEFIDCFSSLAISIICILPVHEYGRSFHLLVCSSCSFFKVHCFHINGLLSLR